MLLVLKVYNDNDILKKMYFANLYDIEVNLKRYFSR